MYFAWLWWINIHEEYEGKAQKHKLKYKYLKTKWQCYLWLWPGWHKSKRYERV